MKRFGKIFKGAGWLNILGMSVAFAAIYVILVQVNYELGYNRQIKDAGRTYIMTMPSPSVEGKYSMDLNRPLPRLVLDQLPSVEKYGVAYCSSGQPYVRVGEGESVKEYMLAFQSMTYTTLDILDIELVSGSFEGLAGTKSVALSQSAAGRMHVGLGDIVRFSNDSFTVGALYRDLPPNRTYGGVEMIYCHELDTFCYDDWSEWSFIHYVRLDGENDKVAFEQQADEVIRTILAGQMESVPEEDKGEIYENNLVRLFSLDEIYFNQEIDDPLEKGNKMTTVTLLLMAILIMAVTLVNYVNFFMSQIPVKLKAVNTHKILGSSRSSLVLGFMAESGILVLVSLMLAGILVFLFKGSVYAHLVSGSLGFHRNIPTVLFIIQGALVVTIALSVYPSLYITSFPMSLALKGTMGCSLGTRSFRYILVGFQFTVSFIFLIFVLCVKGQYDYMMDYDMGFNRERLYNVTVPVNASN